MCLLHHSPGVIGSFLGLSAGQKRGKAAVVCKKQTCGDEGLTGLHKTAVGAAARLAGRTPPPKQRGIAAPFVQSHLAEAHAERLPARTRA